MLIAEAARLAAQEMHLYHRASWVNEPQRYQEITVPTTATLHLRLRCDVRPSLDFYCGGRGGHESKLSLDPQDDC